MLTEFWRHPELVGLVHRVLSWGELHHIETVPLLARRHSLEETLKAAPPPCSVASILTALPPAPPFSLPCCAPALPASKPPAGAAEYQGPLTPKRHSQRQSEAVELAAESDAPLGAGQHIDKQRTPRALPFWRELLPLPARQQERRIRVLARPQRHASAAHVLPQLERGLESGPARLL